MHEPQKRRKQKRIRTIALCTALFFNAQLSVSLAQVEERSTDAAADLALAEDIGTIDVEEVVSDGAIQKRLTKILSASGQFDNLSIRVEEGLVFLEGETALDSHRMWADAIARNTQDVVAVVNRLTLAEKPLWDLAPAVEEVRTLARSAIQIAPALILALVVGIFVLGISQLTASSLRKLFVRRTGSDLLGRLIARVAVVPLLLAGIYIAVRVSGLSQLAATIIGGTGLLGLIVGIAFRDIAENFLASVLISIERPFRIGDLIAVASHVGFVQSVTTRGTVLMTREGNHVQVPNSTIYKEIITNFTANPNIRVDFAVGIGYSDSISKAQDVAMQVLESHPAVLNEPEPSVLIEALGAATINLRIYFWVNGKKHSAVKVKSAAIRLCKCAFDDASISMPDEAREVVFPEGVVVYSHEKLAANMEKPEGFAAARNDRSAAQEDPLARSRVEGDLESEVNDIEKQAKSSRSLSEQESVLAGS